MSRNNVLAKLIAVALAVSFPHAAIIPHTAVAGKNESLSLTRRDGQETDVNICRPLNEGMCTLAVSEKQITVPIPARDAADDFAGTELTKGYAVYDSHCNYLPIQSTIGPKGTGNGFGGDLTVQNWDAPVTFHADEIGPADISGISFSFKGRTYNACDCEDDSHGVTGATACRCEFDCHDSDAGGPPPPPLIHISPPDLNLEGNFWINDPHSS